MIIQEHQFIHLVILKYQKEKRVIITRFFLLNELSFFLAQLIINYIYQIIKNLLRLKYF